MALNKSPKSLLFVPSVKISKYASSLNKARADGVIFDLEDSIEENHKSLARDELHHFLSIHRLNKDVYVRINSSRTRHYSEDLEIVFALQPDALMLAKVESAEEIRSLSSRIDCYQKTTNKELPIFIVVETLKGHYHREEILTASDKCFLYLLGYEDFSADLGIDRPDLNSVNPLSTILMENIISSKRHGIRMLDSVSRKFKPENLSEFRAEVEFGKRVGLKGKLAIHPNQLEIIREVYDPGELLERTQNIKSTFEKLDDGSSVIVNEKGEMEDSPSYRLAKKILVKASNAML